jgi:hypothetical protein
VLFADTYEIAANFSAAQSPQQLQALWQRVTQGLDGGSSNLEIAMQAVVDHILSPANGYTGGPVSVVLISDGMSTNPAPIQLPALAGATFYTVAIGLDINVQRLAAYQTSPSHS